MYKIKLKEMFRLIYFYFIIGLIISVITGIITDNHATQKLIKRNVKTFFQIILFWPIVLFTVYPKIIDMNSFHTKLKRLFDFDRIIILELTDEFVRIRFDIGYYAPGPTDFKIFKSPNLEPLYLAGKTVLTPAKNLKDLIDLDEFVIQSCIIKTEKQLENIRKLL